jgi:hypothetical protein
VALTNQFSKGPGSRSIPATLLIPDGAQDPYPYLWVGGLPATSVTLPGASGTPVAGTFYYGAIYVPHRMVLTGATNLIGLTGGTDKVIYVLWDADGALKAYTAVAGVTVGTTQTLQTRIPFTDPVTVDGPSIYYLGLQINGTTARFNWMEVGNHPCSSFTGVFGTMAAITTPATTFTTDKSPVMGTY